MLLYVFAQLSLSHGKIKKITHRDEFHFAAAHAQPEAEADLIDWRCQDSGDNKCEHASLCSAFGESCNLFLRAEN